MGNYLYPSSPIASMPSAGETLMHVDKFTIDYRPDGQVCGLSCQVVGETLMHVDKFTVVFSPDGQVA